MKTGKQETVSMKEIYQNFDKVFNLQTTDMTAFNDFFNKED